MLTYGIFIKPSATVFINRDFHFYSSKYKLSKELLKFVQPS